jgi:hypothetical protein
MLAFHVQHGSHVICKRVAVDADRRAEGAVQVRTAGEPIGIRAEESFDGRGVRVMRVGAHEFTVGKGHRREE